MTWYQIVLTFIAVDGLLITATGYLDKDKKRFEAWSPGALAFWIIAAIVSFVGIQ